MQFHLHCALVLCSFLNKLLFFKIYFILNAFTYNLLAGEPSVAQVNVITQSFSRRLPALGILSWFWLKYSLLPVLVYVTSEVPMAGLSKECLPIWSSCLVSEHINIYIWANSFIMTYFELQLLYKMKRIKIIFFVIFQ